MHFILTYNIFIILKNNVNVLLFLGYSMQYFCEYVIIS